MGVHNSMWVREKSRAQGASRAVMFALASAAHDESKTCLVSCATLARWAGVDVRSVKRGIAHLEALGELRITRSTGRTNGYLLLLPAESGAPDPWHSVTSDTVPPVTLCPQTSDTVSKTSDTTPPIKYLKDLKGEKSISIPLAVDFALPAETPKAKTDDAAYKGQTAAWVAPTSKREMLAADLWEDAKSEIKMQLVAASYMTYVHGTRAIGWAGDTLQVEVNNLLALDWLNGRLISVVGRTMRTIVGEPVKVEFVLAREQREPTITELLQATR